MSELFMDYEERYFTVRKGKKKKRRKPTPEELEAVREMIERRKREARTDGN